jgi:hypothetical protein
VITGIPGCSFSSLCKREEILCSPEAWLIKVGSTLAFSRSSRHTFTHCWLWSIVKSQGRNFVAMRRMFIFSAMISWLTP